LKRQLEQLLISVKDLSDQQPGEYIAYFKPPGLERGVRVFVSEVYDNDADRPVRFALPGEPGEPARRIALHRSVPYVVLPRELFDALTFEERFRMERSNLEEVVGLSSELYGPSKAMTAVEKTSVPVHGAEAVDAGGAEPSSTARTGQYL
jgi:hypothetical protein